MNIKQLRALVKQGESEMLEFKNSTGSLSSAMQTVCAFLNSDHGGTVVFGVTDDGKITGQDVTDKTKKEISAEISRIEPHAKIDVKYVRVAEKRQAIIFLIHPGEKAPYTYDGRPFTRVQSTTIRMPKEEYVYLHTHHNPTLWENLTTNTCTFKDLDHNRIREVVRIAVEERRLPESALSARIPDVLKKMNLIMDKKLTNAAVILFCKNENKQFMQSNIKLARFKGTDKTEFLDKKELRANAFDLYDKAMDFLSFCLPVSARIEEGNPRRVESPAIPYRVLREAITNALVHRDYSHSGGSVSIAVYDDRVNISNIGALPKGVLLSQLAKEHSSIPRNPIIAKIFYYCGRIESWGRGTLDMIKDCKKVGNPSPKYEEVGGSFSVTLPFREPIRSASTKQLKQADLAKLTKRQKTILDILKEESLNRKQLMERMRTNVTDRAMQLDLAKLKDLGLIQSEGRAKAIIWFLAKV